MVRLLAVVGVTTLLMSGGSALTTAQEKRQEKDRLPFYTALPCDGPSLNEVVIICQGTDDTCTFVRLSVENPDPADFQKSRAEFLSAMARQTVAERDKEIENACEQIAKTPSVDFTKLSLPVRLMRDRGRQYLQAACNCRGKEAGCLTSAMLPSVDAEERNCEIRVATRQETFKQVGKNRWVSNESLPFGCVAASTQVLEDDPKYPGLWTYTLSEIATQPNPLPNDPLCRDFKGTNEVCSWKHPKTGLLNCEQVQLP